LYLAQIIEHLKSGLVIKRNHKNQRNLVLVKYSTDMVRFYWI